MKKPDRFIESVDNLSPDTHVVRGEWLGAKRLVWAKRPVPLTEIAPNLSRTK